ncbi:DUF3617 family protein [Dyella sp. C11]|uniref:DUF3617 domain-containing protein n=1 Tax=Dyella sp. C11 TaxID=2126991 RepID=UPI000D648F3F|nr:DUF3617 family protein [Dyella sp. C11]
MNHVSPSTDSAGRRNTLSRLAAAGVLLAAALIGEPGHADPGDFQAMPGLWKIVTRVFESGHEGAPQVTWHCVDESPDPWVEFAQVPVPGQAQCEQANKRRSSTALSWALQCQGSADVVRGQVKFDSAEHYNAAINVNGKDVVQVEGRRYAACTSPKD